MEDTRLPDGRRVTFWQGGDPTGRPVLFFHGCPDCRLAAVPGDGSAREAGVRLVAVDRPGYGGSTRAASDHLSVADDTFAVADALELSSVGVLGMSVGGGYALACAARHPGRVSSVAVVSSPADVTELDPPWPRDELDAEGQDFFRMLAREPVRDAIERMRPGFASYLADLRPDDPDDADLARRFLEGLDDRDREVAREWDVVAIAACIRESLRGPDGYLRDAAVTFRAWDFDVEALSVDVRVWHGAHDTQHSLRNAKWLADRIPRARLTVLPDDGHLGALHRHWSAILAAL
jgi:pimeloyl-ACP methyl ester carboxylesterase